MTIIRTKEFTAKKAWDAKTITNIHGASVRLHWTDKPYQWHTNDGEEVFAVLDGAVRMHYKINSKKTSTVLNTGDIFYASIGTQRYAEPIGEARVLVIEKEGSI